MTTIGQRQVIDARPEHEAVIRLLGEAQTGVSQLLAFGLDAEANGQLQGAKAQIEQAMYMLSVTVARAWRFESQGR